MKKVLFIAAIFAATSMAFVACGNKENKENKEGEKTEQISRAEEAVRALEAAKSLEDLEAIDKKYSDVKEADFTKEQIERINKAYDKLQKELNK